MDLYRMPSMSSSNWTHALFNSASLLPDIAERSLDSKLSACADSAIACAPAADVETPVDAAKAEDEAETTGVIEGADGDAEADGVKGDA